MISKKIQIVYKCPSCKYESYPAGNQLVELPHMRPVICSNCGYEEPDAAWTDSDLDKELIKRKYGLDRPQSDINTIIQRLSNVEERCSKLENENLLLKQSLELERNSRQFLENEIAKNNAFRERYEKDLVTLESLIELKTIQQQDEDKFQEENK